MPVFVVGLLNNFIYQPILGKLAVRWKKQEFWAFVKMILGQCVFLSIAVVLVLAGGYLLGVPVLSFPGSFCKTLISSLTINHSFSYKYN